MNIPYHIGKRRTFSLQYVTPDENRHKQVKKDFQTDSKVKELDFEAPSGNRLYLLYTSNIASTQSGRSNIVIETESAPEKNPILSHSFLSCYNGVKSSTNLDMRKQFDTNKIPELFERIQWKQTIPAVAGQLLSIPIIAHALPNGNHRSSISFVCLYLDYYSDKSNIAKDLVSNATLQKRVDEYQIESKCLLTVRRNKTKFKILEQNGVTSVERKGGIKILLNEYDLSDQMTGDDYSNLHKLKSQEFVESILKTLNQNHLLNTKDKGKSSYINHLTTV